MVRNSSHVAGFQVFFGQWGDGKIINKVLSGTELDWSMVWIQRVSRGIAGQEEGFPERVM